MSALVSMMHNNIQIASKLPVENLMTHLKIVKDETILYERHDSFLLRILVVLYTLFIGRECSFKVIFILKPVLFQFVIFFICFEPNNFFKSPIINYL